MYPASWLDRQWQPLTVEAIDAAFCRPIFSAQIRRTMITSCHVIRFGRNPVWEVCANGDTSTDDILRLCSQIPKRGDRHPLHGDPMYQDFANLICDGIRVVDQSRGVTRVQTLFSEPAPAAIDEDAPQFPKWPGPVGLQSDGSFVLSPRLYHEMRQLNLSRYQRGIKLPENEPAVAIGHFFDAIWHECAWEMEVPC